MPVTSIFFPFSTMFSKGPLNASMVKSYTTLGKKTFENTVGKVYHFTVKSQHSSCRLQMLEFWKKSKMLLFG